MTERTKCGYMGKWAYIDLSKNEVKIVDSDSSIEESFLGGRGLQGRLLFEKVKALKGAVENPLGPENRIIIGCSAPNDTKIHTAGRGSASFFSPMTRSKKPLLDGAPPVFGLVTHSSVGGSFANKLKKAGIDQLILDGAAKEPMRIEVIDGNVTIKAAEDSLFEELYGKKVVLRSNALNDKLKSLIEGKNSSSIYIGPAGWNLVPYSCLTTDGDRNFGRGGGGAVLASKNIVAITVAGSEKTKLHDEELYNKRMKELDEAIEKAVKDESGTSSFRPTTGTTWWLNRAFKGDYLGDKGGYLPWHNYDEGHFDENEFKKVSTDALLEVSGKHKICSRCRGIICSRMVKTEKGELLPRPEFETAGLFINCGITERESLIALNHLCNEVGLDTMTTAAIVAGAMDMDEKGLLKDFALSIPYGSAKAMSEMVEAVAYKNGGLGTLFGQNADSIGHSVLEKVGAAKKDEVIWCITNAYAGLGYASIGPKAFDSMFTCYATSNRGRGDHTYAWTVQAEEAGLTGAEDIGATVAGSQWGKAVIDSLGICDFFAGDTTGDVFLDLLYAITGNKYTADSLIECGKRTVSLERMLNEIQGRTRRYDAYVPPKFEKPYSA